MEITKLAANERPTRAYAYDVDGFGEFPIDMLRYDAAHPATTNDVAAMFDTAHRRRVSIHSYRPPTAARWESFGWRVVGDGFATGARVKCLAHRTTTESEWIYGVVRAERRIGTYQELLIEWADGTQSWMLSFDLEEAE